MAKVRKEGSRPSSLPTAPKDSGALVTRKSKMSRKSQRKHAHKLTRSARKVASSLGKKVRKANATPVGADDERTDGDKRSRYEEEVEFELVPDEWRMIVDPQTGERLVLSDDKIRLIQQLINLQLVSSKSGADGELEEEALERLMYQRFEDFFTKDLESGIIASRHRPKALPYSKWERAKILHLARTIRRGLLRQASKSNSKEENSNELGEDVWSRKWAWADVVRRENYLAPPKMALPGNEESYRPGPEYLLEEEERRQRLAQDPSALVPQLFERLRHVPSYAALGSERFQRCLDLYLGTRKKCTRLRIDPDSLLPRLPPLESLRPFPETESTQYRGGHPPGERILSLSLHASGKWLASASRSAVSVWEVTTGRLVWSFSSSSSSDAIVSTDSVNASDSVDANTSANISTTNTNPNTSDAVEDAIGCVAFAPTRDDGAVTLAFGYGSRIVVVTPFDGKRDEPSEAYEGSPGWRRYPGIGHLCSSRAAGSRSTPDLAVKGLWFVIDHGMSTTPHSINHISWHRKSDYLCSVGREAAPSSQTVAVHQLSRGITQHPLGGRTQPPMSAVFAPHKPALLVNSRLGARLYDLKQRQLVKKLRLANQAGLLTTPVVFHPSGEHAVVGTGDGRVLWYDLDLSSSPYKALLAHPHVSVSSIAIHPRLPLMASSSASVSSASSSGMLSTGNDLAGEVQLWHQRAHAFGDGLDDSGNSTTLASQNAVIVPIRKMPIEGGAAIVAWHPQQPWMFVGHARGGHISLFV